MGNNSLKVNHDKRENKAISDIELIKQQLSQLRSDVNAKPLKLHPVGSVYASFNNTSPETLFGGTWTRLEDSRILRSSTSSSGSTGGANTVTLAINQIPTHSFSGTTDNTGSGMSISVSIGSYKDVSHSGSTSTSGNHTHRPLDTYDWYFNQGNCSAMFISANMPNYAKLKNTWDAGNHSHTVYYTDKYTTGIGASVSGLTNHNHSFTGTFTNNSQQAVDVTNPYITVYMWKRTA